MPDTLVHGEIVLDLTEFDALSMELDLRVFAPDIRQRPRDRIVPRKIASLVEPASLLLAFLVGPCRVKDESLLGLGAIIEITPSQTWAFKEHLTHTSDRDKSVVVNWVNKPHAHTARNANIGWFCVRMHPRVAHGSDRTLSGAITIDKLNV